MARPDSRSQARASSDLASSPRRRGRTCPLLLAASDVLHPETAAFFDEFAASVQRLAGPSRYLTARAVADHFFDDNPRAVVIATGQRATDALAAASLGHLSFVGAGRSAMPLLLTETSSLHETVQEYVCSNETIGLAYVAGGPAAVDRDVTDDLEAIWDDTNCRPPPSSE